MAKLRDDTTIGGDPIKEYIDDLADDEKDYSDDTLKDHLEKIVRTDPQVVEDESEAEEQRGQSEDFEEVFNEWRRFSHYRGSETSDNLDSWNYDSDKDEVYSTENTPELIGFVSPEKYEDFIFDVTLSSREEHGNYIGVVIAFAEDEDGNEHTLTAMRAPKPGFNEAFGSEHSISDGPDWIVAYDLHGQDHDYGEHEWIPRITLYYESTADDYASDDGSANVASGSEDWYSEHCRIRVERSGDEITVKTTDFGDTSDSWVSGATFTFSLDDYPELEIFKGGASIGYCAQSEPGATYKTNQLPTQVEKIYDIENDTIWTYDAADGSWSSRDPDDDLYPHRIHWNKYYKRLYYVDDERKAFRLALSEDLT